jgi:NMD protein affecting ribosome stability and mRNA decay
MTRSIAPLHRLHRHTPVTTHALRQQAGIPYEVARTVCANCGRVLDERRLRRTAA